MTSLSCCRYIIPGGSAGFFQREGYTFDVGSSMMFGLGSDGTTNLITRALAAVDRKLETVSDPTQIHYHLPKTAAHPEVGFGIRKQGPPAKVNQKNGPRAIWSCGSHRAGQLELDFKVWERHLDLVGV